MIAHEQPRISKTITISGTGTPNAHSNKIGFTRPAFSSLNIFMA